MTLEILTPDKSVYEGEATSVTLPGTLGFFEILNHHAPIISTLEDGKVTVRGGKGGKEETFLFREELWKPPITRLLFWLRELCRNKLPSKPAPIQFSFYKLSTN